MTTAAELLGVTVSAVSQRLAKLETAVAQPLLERRGRSVRLTAAGELLVGRTDQIMSLMQAATMELSGGKGVVVGRIRIASFSSAARGLLPVALAGLRRDFPELRIEVSECEPDASVVALMKGDVDLAVVQDWHSAPLDLPGDLCKSELPDDVFDVALPTSHRLARRDSIQLEELLQESWVTWPQGSGCQKWLLHTLRSRGGDPDIAFTAGEYSTQLALVAAGFGIAVIPRLGGQSAPEGARLVGLWPELHRHVYVVWRATHDWPALQATVQALREAAVDQSVLPATPVHGSSSQPPPRFAG